MAYGVSVVADVCPQTDNVRHELGREARVREGLGEDRCEARGVRLGVALPPAGRVDLREVCVANHIAVSFDVSFDRRHIDSRAGAQEDREDARMSSTVPAVALQTPRERRPDITFVPLVVQGVDISTRPQ